MSIARLQLILDSTQMRAGAEATARELNKVTASSKAAEAAVKAQARVMAEAANVAKSQAQAAKASADATIAEARAQREAARAAAEAVRAKQQLAGVMGQLRNVVAAYLSLNTARALADMADRATLLAARLRLVTASAGEAAGVQFRLAELARENGVAFADLSQIYTRIARGAAELGIQQRTVMQTTEALSLAVRVSGATAQEASAALLQFSQGIASGKLGGEELRAVLEQLPRVAQAVAAGLGVTTGQLRELGAAGKLGPTEVLNALTTQLEKLRAEAAQLPSTIGQGVERLGNGALALVDALNRATGLGAGLAAMFTTIAEKAEQAASAIDRVNDPNAGFTQASAEARNLSWSELNARLGTARQAYLERRAQLGSTAFRNDRRLEELSALLDPVRALEAERRRRMTQRTGTMNRITVSAPEVTDRDRQRAADEAARERDQIAAYEQDLDRYAYDVMAAFERDRERTRLAPPRASAPFVTDIGFDGGALQQSLRLLDPVFKRMEAAKEAAEQIRENLTRGLQQSVATFAEGLMTDGLSSARRFAETFAGLLRRAAAEAIAAALMQRVSIGAVMSLGGGILPGAGSGAAGTGPAGATASVTAAAGTSAAFTGVAAAALVVVAAFSELQASAQRVRSANESVARLNNDARGRILRATGREAEADALDREQANRERLEAIERQRQDALRQVRESLTARGSRILRVLPGGQGAAIALARRRDAEIARINRQFEEAARLEREAQEAERGAIGGGSIGDYNAPAGLNVAAMIGDIRRATLAAPEVPGGGVGGGREGLTIVINGPVTTEAKSASEFVRELQAMAQTQYGSPAEWSRVTVMA